MQGTGMAAAAGVRESQIPQAFNRIQTTIARLGELASTLEQRFSPALRPTGPTPEPSNRIEKSQQVQVVRETKAPIAESIDVMNDTLVRFEHRLMELIQRSEI